MNQLDLLHSASALALLGDGERITLDRYYTPPRLARAGLAVCQRHLKAPISGVALAGHVGGGSWARGILDLTPAHLIIGDIDRRAPAMLSSAWNRRRAAPFCCLPSNNAVHRTE